jgi:hypothetical protein
MTGLDDEGAGLDRDRTGPERQASGAGMGRRSSRQIAEVSLRPGDQGDANDEENGGDRHEKNRSRTGRRDG